MVALGAVLVPVGGVLVAHYYLGRDAMNESLIAELYDGSGQFRGVNVAGMLAWGAGAAVFFVAGSVGGTVPALVTSIAVYIGAEKVLRFKSSRVLNPGTREP
jgi:cytosine/uracil/thiamine/allantoin permease